MSQTIWPDDGACAIRAAADQPAALRARRDALLERPARGRASASARQARATAARGDEVRTPSR